MGSADHPTHPHLSFCHTVYSVLKWNAIYNFISYLTLNIQSLVNTYRYLQPLTNRHDVMSQKP